MKQVIFTAVALIAFATIAQQAQAKNVCQWTGSDWACGDGNTVTAHYSRAQGPDMVITPIAAPRLPAGQVLPNVYGVQKDRYGPALR